MKYSLLKLLSPIIFLLIFTSCGHAQLSKEEVETKVNQWYEAHKDGYDLVINDQETKSYFGYTTEKEIYDKGMITVKWKGMTISLHFKASLEEMEWTTEGFQKNFQFVVLDDIEHDVLTPGWGVYPITPSSSNEKGVKFLEVSQDQIKLEIDWETYSFYGTSQTDFCKDQLQIADNSLPKECFIHVEKRLPLHIELSFQYPKTD